MDHFSIIIWFNFHLTNTEQVQSKSNNRDNLSNLGKNLIKNNIKSIEPEVELKIV